MPTLPFMKGAGFPINYIPICPSFSQVLSAEKMRQSIHIEGAHNFSAKVDALISEFDTAAVGEMSTLNTCLSPEEECLCGKMYFVVELLRQIEQQSLGYTMITIITTKADVETALLKVIRHYISSPVIKLETQSLRAGYSESSWTGGVTVHIRSAPDQPLNRVAFTDMVLTYDADLVGAHLAHVLLAIPFDYNPAILHLCTMGTPEQEFIEYFLAYARINTLDLSRLLHEEVSSDTSSQLSLLFQKELPIFSNSEFKMWNDSIAQQVSQWFLFEISNDYHYKPIKFPTDVPMSCPQPPSSGH